MPRSPENLVSPRVNLVQQNTPPATDPRLDKPADENRSGDTQGIAPFSFIQCRAALVSRPPEKAMPTFWPTGVFWRMVDIVFTVRYVGDQPKWQM